MGEFFNSDDEFKKYMPSFLQEKDAYVNFIRIICSLIDVNRLYDPLTRSLQIVTPNPTKKALEAFFNDLFDPENRGVQVSYVLQISTQIDVAQVIVNVPASILGNSFFPSDTEYVKILLGNLLRLGLAQSSIVVADFTIFFEDLDNLGNFYCIFFEEENTEENNFVFELDFGVGEAVTNARAFDFCIFKSDGDNGYLFFSNLDDSTVAEGGKFYIKQADILDDGTALSSSEGINPFVLLNFLFFTNSQDSSRMYVFNLGTFFEQEFFDPIFGVNQYNGTIISSPYPTLEDSDMVYADGTNLFYKKVFLNENLDFNKDRGSKINNITTGSSCVVSKNRLVYTALDGVNARLFIKNIFKEDGSLDTSNGVELVSSVSSNPEYIPELDAIIYTRFEPSIQPQRLWIKYLNEVGDGFELVSVPSKKAKYDGNGNLYYINAFDNKIYKKNLFNKNLQSYTVFFNTII